VIFIVVTFDPTMFTISFVFNVNSLKDNQNFALGLKVFGLFYPFISSPKKETYHLVVMTILWMG